MLSLANSFPQEANLHTLPTDFYFELSKYIAARDMALLGRVCRELHFQTSNKNIWNLYYKKDVGAYLENIDYAKCLYYESRNRYAKLGGKALLTAHKTSFFFPSSILEKSRLDQLSQFSAHSRIFLKNRVIHVFPFEESPFKLSSSLPYKKLFHMLLGENTLVVHGDRAENQFEVWDLKRRKSLGIQFLFFQSLHHTKEYLYFIAHNEMSILPIEKHSTLSTFVTIPDKIHHSIVLQNNIIFFSETAKLYICDKKTGTILFSSRTIPFTEYIAYEWNNTVILSDFYNSYIVLIDLATGGKQTLMKKWVSDVCLDQDHLFFFREKTVWKFNLITRETSLFIALGDGSVTKLWIKGNRLILFSEDSKNDTATMSIFGLYQSEKIGSLRWNSKKEINIISNISFSGSLFIHTAYNYMTKRCVVKFIDLIEAKELQEIHEEGLPHGMSEDGKSFIFSLLKCGSFTYKVIRLERDKVV